MTALFWKALGAVLLTLILTLAVGKREKDLAALLLLAGCCTVAAAAITCLEPVLDFLRELEGLGQLGGGLMGSLMKAVGISLVAEIAGTLCADSGSASLGKLLRMLGSGVIVYLSIPFFQALLALIQEILGDI